MPARRPCSSLLAGLFFTAPKLPQNPGSRLPVGFRLTSKLPQNPRNHLIPAELPPFFFLRSCRTSSSTVEHPQSLSLLRDGNFHESSSSKLHVCPGCGVHMQDSDQKQPGFFIEPSAKKPDYGSRIDRTRPIAGEHEIPSSIKRGCIVEPEHAIQSEEKMVVCARCHSLRHYGKVKDPTVENLLPDFDFHHTIGRRLASAEGTRSVVLFVVDAADFDGSFPRKAATFISAKIDENHRSWKEGKSGNVPRVVLVVTKIDLLPPSLSPDHFDQWVRKRAKEGGANKITSVHLVSSIKNWGLKNLMDDVRSLAGSRGNVWAIGAQNAGKSTLINAIRRHADPSEVSPLTEAPVPGTTLGIVRMDGVFRCQAKVFDTPGLLHPHQITTRLTREEQRLVRINRELKPRTYRIKVGHSVHVAGLVRMDVEESSVETMYMTVWASPDLPLHMGKTECACSAVFEDHFGRQLQPPVGAERVKQMGKWERREFQVRGNSWDASSTDIAVAGLGWLSVGLRGEAMVGVWTYTGVGVVMRDSIIHSRARVFEGTGFSVSRIVSRADRFADRDPETTDSGKKKKKKKTEKKTDTVIGDVTSL